MRFLSSALALTLAGHASGAVIGIDLGARFLKVRRRARPARAHTLAAAGAALGRPLERRRQTAAAARVGSRASRRR